MLMPIEPYVSFGPLRLGMTRAEVRNSISAAVEAFRKLPGDVALSDAFSSQGIYVYYDKDDVCEAVEVAAPSVPVLLGQHLVGQPFTHVRAWFENNDPETAVDSAGLTSPKFGVGIYAPSALKDPADPVESVMVFREGYYDFKTGTQTDKPS